MYHIELRQFPHNFCHFNLTAEALQETVLDGWARGAWVEVGERRWNPHEASLTVIEGPELPVQQLSMGRGWRNAVRQGTDVTATVLADARARLALSGGGPGAGGVVEGPGGAPTPRAVPDSQTRDQAPAEAELARRLLLLLGERPGPLLRAWQLAMEAHPDRTPSECLAAAEDFVAR